MLPERHSDLFIIVCLAAAANSCYGPTLDADVPAVTAQESTADLGSTTGPAALESTGASPGATTGPAASESTSKDDPSTAAPTAITLTEDSTDAAWATTASPDTSSETNDEDSSSSSGPAPGCGDGIVTPGELCFAPAIPLSMGPDPRDVEVVDLNADGHADILVVHGYQGDWLTLRMGLGGGTFSQLEYRATGSNPSAVATPDLNGDASPDVVVANGYSQDLSVYLNDGAGTLGMQEFVPVGSFPSALSAADFNGDDLDDLAVATSGMNAPGLLVFLSDGGGYASGTPVGTSASQDVASVKFDGDNILDLVSTGSNTVDVSLGSGSDSFILTTSSPTAWNPVSLAVGDLDEDGRLDAVVTKANGLDNKYIRLHIGTEDGGFGAPISHEVGSTPHGLAVADMNSDGNLDVIVCVPAPPQVVFLLGDGAGGLSEPNPFTLEGNPSAVALADFNQDNVPDLAVANLLSLSLVLSDP